MGICTKEFVIEHEGDTVWSSRYCESTDEDAEGGVEPVGVPCAVGEKDVSRLAARPRRRVVQKADRGSVPRGQYELIVKLGDEESEPAPFTLKGDPADDATDDPGDDAGADAGAGEAEGDAAGEGDGAAGEDAAEAEDEAAD